MKSQLLRPARMIERGSHDGLPEEEDRNDVQERFARASNVLSPTRQPKS